LALYFSGVYLSFLASIWSAGFGTFLQVSALASFFGWRIVQILRQRSRKTTNKSPTTLGLIPAGAASQSAFINEQL
jgi:membrane protein implicated in regulation of membrane protease activity